MPATTHATTAEFGIVDLRRMSWPERHATVFATFEALEPGATFVPIIDHAPILLLRRIAETLPGLFGSEFVQNGPEVWQAAITRTDN